MTFRKPQAAAVPHEMASLPSTWMMLVTALHVINRPTGGQRRLASLRGKRKSDRRARVRLCVCPRGGRSKKVQKKAIKVAVCRRSASPTINWRPALPFLSALVLAHLDHHGGTGNGPRPTAVAGKRHTGLGFCSRCSQHQQRAAGSQRTTPLVGSGSLDASDSKAVICKPQLAARPA